jgi:hypothetical protein
MRAMLAAASPMTFGFWWFGGRQRCTRGRRGGGQEGRHDNGEEGALYVVWTRCAMSNRCISPSPSLQTSRHLDIFLATSQFTFSPLLVVQLRHPPLTFQAAPPVPAHFLSSSRGFHSLAPTKRRESPNLHSHSLDIPLNSHAHPHVSLLFAILQSPCPQTASIAIDLSPLPYTHSITLPSSQFLCRQQCLLPRPPKVSSSPNSIQGGVRSCATICLPVFSRTCSL